MYPLLLTLILLLGGCASSPQPSTPKHDTLTPLEEVTHSHDWTQVSLYHSYALALKRDGSLWCFGEVPDGKYHGIIPDVTRPLPPAPTPFYRRRPIQVGMDHDWVSVSSGAYAIATKSDGSLWGWGGNLIDRQGRHHHTTRPILISPEKGWRSALSRGSTIGECQPYTIGLKHDGTLWGWGDTMLSGGGNQPITTLRGWRGVSLGCYSVIAQHTSGRLWGWGYPHGIRPLPTTPPTPVTQQTLPPTKLAEGTTLGVSLRTLGSLLFLYAYHPAEIKPDGTLWLYHDETAPNGTLQSHLRQERSHDTTWHHLSQADQHLALLKRNGSLWFVGVK